MPKETENFSLKKPLYSDTADIAVLNENFDEIDRLMKPSVSADREPGSQTEGKLQIVLGWLANRIKAITGLSIWQANPSVTLEDCSNHIKGGTHSNATTSSDGFMSATDKASLVNATSSYTGSTLIKRDANGRAKVQTPSSDYDIANKTYVDSNFLKKNSPSSMSALLTAHSNTSYSTKQVRNIVFWTSGTTPPATSNGDIVIKTF